MLEPVSRPIQVVGFYDNPSPHPPADAGFRVKNAPRALNATDKVKTRGWEAGVSASAQSSIFSE